jgi:tetratricopeptide (TPR) repeat protein
MNFGVALAGAGRFDEAVARYQKALEINPNYPEAHNNLGLALARDGRIDEAIAHYRKALEVDPQYAAIHNNLGAALARSGNLNEAIDHFQKFLEVTPDNVEVHGNLIRALTQAGRSSEAVSRLESILRLHPNSAAVHNTLGVALIWQRKTDEAIAHFNRALEINPGLIEAHQNLGDTLFSLQGKSAEALPHWREVLRAAPNQVPVLNRAAFVMATDPDASVRNGREAVELAERAVQLTGGREPATLDTLAAAYAEEGRFAEAAETARRALALATDQRLVEALKSRISLYEANTPYRR